MRTLCWIHYFEMQASQKRSIQTCALLLTNLLQGFAKSVFLVYIRSFSLLAQRKRTKRKGTFSKAFLLRKTVI